MRALGCFFALVLHTYICESRCIDISEKIVSVFTCIELKTLGYPSKFTESYLQLISLDPIDYAAYNSEMEFVAVFHYDTYCFTRPGNYILGILCMDDSNYDLINFIVIDPIITYSIEPVIPQTISDFFSFSISVGNDGLSDLLSFQFTLSLTDCYSGNDYSYNLIGEHEKVSNLNFYTFQSLRIKKSGCYSFTLTVQIQISGWDMYSTVSPVSEFFISSHLKEIELSCDPVFQQYYINKCTLTALADNKIEYFEGFFSQLIIEFNSPNEKIEWASTSKDDMSEIVYLTFFKTYGLVTYNAAVTELSTGKIVTTLIHKHIHAASLSIDFINDSSSRAPFDINGTIKTYSQEIIDINMLQEFELEIVLKTPYATNSGLNFTVEDKFIIQRCNLKIDSNPFTIKNIKVLSSGLFYFNFNAKSLNLPETQTNYFKAINYINKVSIFHESVVSNYRFVELSLDIIGDDLNHYLSPITINIKETSNLGIGGDLDTYMVNTNTSKIFIYFLGSGVGTIICNINEFSEELLFNVQASKLMLSLNPTPIDTQSFTACVKISDISDSVLVSITFHVTLSLILIENNSGNLTGGLWEKDIHDNFCFENLKIYASGSFKIQASSTGNLTNTESEIFTISNKIQYALIELNESSIIAYKNFTIYVKLIGEDYNIFRGDCNIQLNQPAGIVWYEKEKNCLGQGILSFEGYFMQENCFTIQINTFYFLNSITLAEKDVCSSKAILEFSLDRHVSHNQVSSIGDSFKLIARIKDYDGFLLKNANTSIYIDLIGSFNQYYPNIDMFYNQNFLIDVFEGLGVSFEINLPRAGYYTIKGLGDSTSYYELRLYVNNYVTDILVFLNPVNFSIYTPVELSVKVLGADGNQLADSYNFVVYDMYGLIIKKIITDGYFRTIINTKDALIYHLNVVCHNLEKSFQFEVHPLYINLSFTNIPLLSSDIFGINGGAYDKFKGLRCEYEVYLLLESLDNNNSGLYIFDFQKNHSIFGGSIFFVPCTFESFSYFRILSSGTFKITAKSIELNTEKIIPYTSDIFRISNKILSINLSREYIRVSIAQMIELKVQIIGEDNQKYLQDSEIQIRNYSEHILNCYYTKGMSSCFYTPLNEGVTFLTATAGGKSSSTSLIVIKFDLIQTNLILPENNSISLNASFHVKDTLNETRDLNEILDYCYIFLEINENINSSGFSINGTLTKKLENSKVTFDENYILSSGLFSLRFSSNCSSLINEFVTPLFSIRNSIKNIDIKLNNSEITVYKSFYLEIRINGSDDKFYLHECILFIKDQDDITWATESISNGLGFAYFYLTETKEYSLVTSCGGIKSNIVKVRPSPLSFKITVLNQEGDVSIITASNKILFADIKVVDSQELIESKNYNNGSYPFTLSLLNNSNQCSGLTFEVNDYVYDFQNYSGYTETGQTRLNLKILSSGNFTIEVSNSFLPILSNNFTISSINYIKNFTINITETTVFMSNYMKIDLKGDDNHAFKENSKLTITDFSDYNNKYQCMNFEGECIVPNLTLTSLGQTRFNLDSFNFNSSFSIKGLPIKISSTFVSSNVTKSNETFDIIFSLKDNLLESDICHKDLDSCTYELNILPDLNFTSSGRNFSFFELKMLYCSTYIFSKIKILSLGTFQLMISSSCFFESWISPYSISIINYPKHIFLDIKNTIVTAYFEFSVIITIIAEDNQIYYNDASVEIIDQNGTIWAEKIISYYSNTIYIVLNDTKPFELTARCNGVILSNTIFINSTSPLFFFEIQDMNEVSVDSLNSTSNYYAKIKVINSTGGIESKNYRGNGFYPFSLTLIPLSDNCSGISATFNGFRSDFGIYNSTTFRGEATIELKILSSGDFSLSLESLSELPIPKKSLFLKSNNKLKYFTTNNISMTTIYLPTNVTLMLYGDDNKPLLKNLKIELINSLDPLDNYSCENVHGECKVIGLVLTKLGITRYNFISIYLNDFFTIEGMPINLFSDIPTENVTKSDETFDLITKLLDNSNRIVVNNKNIFYCDVSLTLIPHEYSIYSGKVVLFGSKARPEPGSIEFKSVRILSSGKFSLKLSSDCDFITNWTSPFHFSVKNYPKSISLSNNRDLTIFEYFDVTVEILGDDDQNYKGFCNFSFSSYLKSNNPETFYSGEIKKLTLFYEKAGKYSPNISCSDDNKVASSNIYNEVFNQSLEIYMVQLPFDSTPFSLKVCQLDKSLNRLNSLFFNQTETTVNISLINSNFSSNSGLNFSGIVQKTMNSDFCAEFNDLKILSSGNFSIKASSNSLYINPYETKFFTVTNAINRFNYFFSRSLFTFFNFDLTIDPIGDDESLYILPTTYILSTSDNSLRGSLQIISSGKAEFKKLHFISSGYKIIHIKTTSELKVVDFSFTVNVSKSSVNLTIENIRNFNKPVTSEDLINVLAVVVDDQNLTETENGPFNYVLNIGLNENLAYSSSKGVTTVKLIETIAEFKALRILAYGTYWIEVGTTQDITSKKTQEFQVLNMIKNIKLTSSTSIFSTFEDIQILAEIFGDDDEIFKINTNYSLNHNASQLVSLETLYSGDAGKFNFSFFSKKHEKISLSLIATFGNYSFMSSQINFEIIESLLIISVIPENIITGENFDLGFQLLANHLIQKVLRNFNEFQLNISITCIEYLKINVNCSNFEYSGPNSAISKYGEVIFKGIQIKQNSFFKVNLNLDGFSIIYLNSTYNFSSYIEPNFELKFGTDKGPTNSNEYFSLVVFSYYGNFLKLSNIDFEIYFSKAYDSVVSGEVLLGLFNPSKKTDYLGKSNITNLYILSSGYFKFEIYHKLNLKATLFTGFIQNSIKSILVWPGKFIYEFSPVIINYVCIGEDENPFILPTIISISEAKNLSFKGNHFNENTSGFFNLILLEKNNYTFIISNNLTSLNTSVSVVYLNIKECNRPNMRIDEKNETCLCEEGFFLNDTLGECQVCNKNCKKCNNFTSCYECNFDNSLVVEGGCECNDEYFFDGIGCSSCLKGCKKCSNLEICEECLNGFTKLENKCLCTEDKIIINNKCICKPGYQSLDNNNCSLCIRWMQKRDFNIKLIENYNAIQIDINSSLEINQNEKEFREYIINKDILGEDFTIIKFQNTFKISLGKNNKVFSNDLELNLSNFYANNNICGFRAVVNSEKISFITEKEKPRPEAVIFQNLLSDKICDEEKIYSFDGKNSRGNFQNELIYEFQVFDKFDRKNKLYDFNDSVISFKIDNSFEIKSIIVVLKVKTYFGTEHSSEISVDINNSQKLFTEIGAYYSCWYSIDCQIMVDNLIFCKKFNDLSYHWEILLGNEIKLSRNTPLLTIESKSLKPEKYIFKLTISTKEEQLSVSQGQIEIIPDKPQVFIDRLPGSISRKFDLTLTAKEKSSSSNFRFLKESDSSGGLFLDWKCKIPNSENNIWSNCFTTNEDIKNITISKESLKDHESISVRLEATSNELSSFIYFNASIIDQEVPSVKFKIITTGNPEKFPRSSSTIIEAISEGTENLSCKFSINITNKSPAITGCQIEINPLELDMKSGMNYQLNLKVLEFDFYYSFKINTPPQHGSFFVDPPEGKEFETIFVFIAKDWFDDQEDLPLRYSFTYGDESNPAILRMSQADRYSTKLACVERPKVLCRVYDSLDDFTEIAGELKVKKQKDLTEIIQQNLEKIEPPTSIPAVIFNVLAATLMKNEYQGLYQEIFNRSTRHLNDFIDISSPSDAFISQSVNIMKVLTSNQNLIDQNSKNSDLGLSVTRNILKNVENIGVNKYQAEDLLNILQKLIVMSDEIVVQGDEKLLEFTTTSSKITTLIMRRFQYVSETKVSSKDKKTSSKISVEKIGNLQNFKSKNKGSLYNIESVLLENSDKNSLIGIVHTSIQSKPSEKSNHQLISLSLYENSEQYQENPIKPIEIDVVIEIPVNFSSKDATKGKCLYFDEISKEWSNKGCKKLTGGKDSAFCSCNHLTTFTFGFIQVSLSMNKGVKEFTLVTLSLPGFVLPVVLFIAFIFTMIRAKIVKQVTNNLETTETINSIDTKSLYKNSKLSGKETKLSTMNSSSNHLTGWTRLSHLSIESNSLSELSNLERPNYEVEMYSDQEILIIQENPEQPEIRSPIESEENQNLPQLEEEKEIENYLNQLDYPEQVSLDNQIELEENLNEYLSHLDDPQPSPSKTSKIQKIREKLQKALIFYNSYCHTIHVIFLNSPVPNKYFQITKIYFILFLEILFDALFFDYKRNDNSEKLKNTLEENFKSFNVITVLFTAALILIAKLILYIIEIVPVKGKIKFRFIILPFVFVLLYGYFLYEVSCLSTAFGKEVSRAWLICCLISIATELTIFEPLASMAAFFIREKVKKTQAFKRISRLKIFWRVFRCDNCKKCQDCRNEGDCVACQNCEICCQGS